MDDESDTEKELSNVVMFPTHDTDPIDMVGYIYERGEFCNHPGLFVDEKERQCRCQKCGSVVDAFDHLLSVARRETQYASNIKALREEERRRRDNIEKLIQIERNAKARIKRLDKKPGCNHEQ